MLNRGYSSTCAMIVHTRADQLPGAQFEGDLGEILVLGTEISPYIGLREKWDFFFFFFFKFSSCQHTIDML